MFCYLTVFRDDNVTKELKEEKIIVNPDNICYINSDETDGSKCELHMMNGAILLAKDSLDDIYDRFR